MGELRYDRLFVLQMRLTFDASLSESVWTNSLFSSLPVFLSLSVPVTLVCSKTACKPWPSCWVQLYKRVYELYND